MEWHRGAARAVEGSRSSSSGARAAAGAGALRPSCALQLFSSCRSRLLVLGRLCTLGDEGTEVAARGEVATSGCSSAAPPAAGRHGRRGARRAGGRAERLGEAHDAAGQVRDGPDQNRRGTPELVAATAAMQRAFNAATRQAAVVARLAAQVAQKQATPPQPRRSGRTSPRVAGAGGVAVGAVGGQARAKATDKKKWTAWQSKMHEQDRKGGAAPKGELTAAGEELWELFQDMDDDQSGELEAEEFANMAMKLGGVLSARRSPTRWRRWTRTTRAASASRSWRIGGRPTAAPKGGGWR